MVWGRLWSWLAEKAPCFIGDVGEVNQAAALADDVEEIAMFPAGGICPFTDSALARFCPLQPDEHRSAGRIANVAHCPVAALSSTVGEVMTAHSLGIARETLCQFGCLRAHR